MGGIETGTDLVPIFCLGRAFICLSAVGCGFVQNIFNVVQDNLQNS
jgi:hypothetical protein